MSSGKKSTQSPQLSLPILERVQLSFANFVDERGHNRQLLNTLRTLVESASASEPVTSGLSSMYVAGVSGSGKTHLLIAVLNELASNGRGARCQYLDFARLKEFGLSVPEFTPNTVNLLDNVDSLAGDRDHETTLFGVVERIRQAGAILVATGAQPVRATPWALADVASRLAAGLLFGLTEMSELGTRMALCQRFNAGGLRVSEPVLDYILTHYSRDKHALFAFVDDLDRSALREQRRITIPFLKDQGLV